MAILEGMFECKRFGGSAMDSRFSLKGSAPQYAPDRYFDTEHIRLDVVLDPKGKSIRGLCETTLLALRDGVDRMVFNAVSLKVEKITLKGRPLKYEYDGRKLDVRLPNPVKAGVRLEISVGYRAVRPKLGMHFIGPDKHYPQKPVQVWTQGEDEYARYWFPCFDSPGDRTTTEMIVSVPKGMTAISNGRLIRKSDKKGRTSFHWRQDVPHATYLVTLAAGYFSEIKDKWRNVPVTYYCQPGREEDAKRAFGKTPRMMEFFSKSIGVGYAYAKYAQVAALDFIYGGMENTSATTQTALTLHDERAHLDFSSDPLVAHELAHQWFGDLLTCKDWSHAWLNESFATYFEALFTEFDKGADEFAYELHQNAESYFEEDRDHYRRPICTKVFKQPSDLFDRHLYEKGSLVLHMIRNILGDRDFWRAMRVYVADNRAKTVETGDLVRAIEKATGRNLNRFFDQWVFKAGHPEYKVRYWWDEKSKTAHVRVVQTQDTNGENSLFSMPASFSFHTDRGERRFTETVDKKSHLFKFKLPSEPLLALFDPDHVILKKTDFPKPEAMWIRQLERDSSALGRLEAAQALSKIPSAASVSALAAALSREKFWAVQGEIAQSLAAIRTPGAVSALLLAYDRWEHPKARRALLSALGSVKSEAVKRRLKGAAQKERSYFCETQTLKALAQTGDPSLLPYFKGYLNSESWNDVIRSGALEAIAALRLPESVELLKKYAAYGHAHTTRMAAIRALSAVAGGAEDSQRLFVSLTQDPYLLVQIAAVRALHQTGNERCVPALRKLAEGDWDGRLKRTAEEAILKITKGIEESEIK